MDIDSAGSMAYALRGGGVQDDRGARRARVVWRRLFLRDFLPSYSRKKGENLATKEDIAEITHKIESVRASLGSQLHVSQFRYEKEFQVLWELSECLVELRDAARGLRPNIDRNIPDERQDEERRSRLERWQQAALAFYSAYQKRRPFYPEPIHELMARFDKMTSWEAFQFQTSHPDKGPRRDDRYWEKALENGQKISELCEETIQAIRARVREWEKLNVGDGQ